MQVGCKVAFIFLEDIFFLKFNLIFKNKIWLCLVFVAACGLFLVAVSGVGGYSVAVVCRLLIVVASFVAE